MAKAFIDDTNLTNIANAIRTKLGVADTYLPSEMAGGVLSIPKRKVVDFNVSPITLNSAKANSLQYVKAYGKCEQNGTPTPTTPVDIVCNNGILKVDNNGNVYTQGNQETLQLGTDIATCERLLSLDDYTDTQEIVSGIVNRKIGIKVLDGTEDWTYEAQYNRFYTPFAGIRLAILARTLVMLSTHYLCISDGRAVSQVPNNSFYGGYRELFVYFKTADYTTVSDWTQYLAEQYAAGTPVIIVYPLATPTTETVTAQSMQTVEGDNTLEITQSALSGLEVECEYFLQ